MDYVRVLKGFCDGLILVFNFYVYNDFFCSVEGRGDVDYVE